MAQLCVAVLPNQALRREEVGPADALSYRVVLLEPCHFGAPLPARAGSIQERRVRWPGPSRLARDSRQSHAHLSRASLRIHGRPQLCCYRGGLRDQVAPKDSTGPPRSAKRRTVRRFAAGAIVLIGTAVACGAGSQGGHRPDALARLATAISPLAVTEARTPRLRVPRYDTTGTYPQVRDAVDLQAVNAALRRAVLADQREYTPYARREKPRVSYPDHGVYRTAIDRKYVSASTAVVSALIPLTREVFPGQHDGDGWLGVTVRVPSGTRVTITDLFAKPRQGLRVLATAWTTRIRRTSGRPCLRIYASHYSPTVSNYRAFALTPAGVSVGSWEHAACYRLVATIPYAVLRPYLSKLGATLVAGVRKPR
jgi:hypothetical protein